MMNRKQVVATKEPSKPSWRSAAGKPKTEGKLWSNANSPRPIGLSRGFKLFASFTLLLALTAFYVLFLFRGDMKPTVLVFPIAEYAYPWAPNGWAIEDANYLISQAKESSKFYAIKAADRQERSWEEWFDAHLHQPNFIAGGPGDAVIFPKYQSLIVYLSGHVDTNESDEPCLLVPRPGNPKKSGSQEAPWYGTDPVPLKQVLEKLCKGMKDRKRNWWSNQPHRKLVVLDIGKQPANLQLSAKSGKLHEQIRKVVESLDEPNLAVLLSCGANQRSWTLPERGGSNFGLHFARALSGAADPKRSGRINLEQLVSYLSKHVDDTAQSQRFESQTPVCYRGAEGKAANEKANHFEIALAGSNRFTSPPVALNRSDFGLRAKLEDAWDRYSKWQSDMVALDPWTTNEVLSRLSIADGLLLAGPTLSGTLKIELERIDALLSQTAPQWPIEEVGGQSKVLAHETTIKEMVPENRETILGWLEQRTQADGKVLAQPPKLKRQTAIAFAWNWIVQRRDRGVELSVEDWQRVMPMFEQSAELPNATLPSRDLLLFQSIITGVRGAMEQPNASLPRLVRGIPRLLDAHQKLVEINNTSDPRLWQWLDGQSGLHRAYFDALDNWLLGTAEGLQRSEAIMNDLLGTANEESKLYIARTQKTALQSAWKTHDELSLLLPKLDWIADHEPDLVGESKISSNDVSKFFRLHAFLAQPQFDGQSLSLIQEVVAISQSLQDRLSASAQRLAVEQATIDAKSRRDISLWLEQPVDLRGAPSTRSVLRKKLLRYFDEPLTLTNASDKRPDEPMQDARKVANGKLSANTDGSLVNAWWRETSSAIPSSNSNALSTKPDANAANFRKQCGEAIALVSEQIKTAVNHLNSDSKQAEARNEVIKTAWSGRLLAPYFVGPVGVCPTRHHWAISYQLGLRTYAEQALDDFWIVPSPSGSFSESEFYSALAENYLKLAESLPGKVKADGLANTSLTKQCRLELEDKRVQSRAWESVIWSGLPTKPTTESFLDPEFSTPSIDGGTILSGSQLKAPTLVSRNKRNVRIETTPSSNALLPPLQAFLRGRTSEGVLNVAKLNSVPQLEWSIDQSVTKVRVNGVASPRQILFVLDCSASLEDLEHKRSKESLLAILDRLTEEDTEVGLLVFGHLAKWKLQDGTCEYAEDVASKLGLSIANRTPENDFDLLVGMKKLNEQTKNEFQSKCDALRQFGFTPLHASINKGLEALKKVRRADFSQHLVLITDGADNVYTDSKGRTVDNTPKARPYPFGKGANAIALELTQAGIQSHCIRYAFENSAGAVDSIPLLFKANPIYDANNKDQLKLALSKILNIRSFSVGVEGKIEEKAFGETFGSRLTRPSKLDIKVLGSTAAQEVLARGGEYYDVRFDPTLNTFRFAPLDEKTFATSVVPQDKSEPQTRVTVLAGDRQGLTQFVRVGIVPVLESQPPRRPARIWAELKITAIENGPERTVYVSDVQWESEKKSPVFRIPIQQGRVKEIRVWMSFQEGNPNKVFLSNWKSKDNRSLAEQMDEPEKSPEGTAPWSLTIKPQTKNRIRWSINSQSNNAASGKAVDLKRIAYKLGQIQVQTYTFTEQPSDVEISYESMPEADRPNTDRWLTTDWLKVDAL